MSATMLNMDYVHVDNLLVDQLMENDLVEIEGEVVEIISISSLKDGYALTYKNEFGEEESAEFSDDAKFKLFLLM